MQVKQRLDGIFISQTKYALNLIKRFGFENGKNFEIPMSTTLRLSKDSTGKDVDLKLYRSMIGSFLYLTASRPDIALSVGICARYQSNPKESHLTAVKQIIQYVASFVNVGLWYPYDTSVQLAGYTDVDWAGNIDDRKSTSGACFYIENCLVSWFSKKQSFVLLSTTEAEYIAAENACTQLVWMKHMLSDYGIA